MDGVNLTLKPTKKYKTNQILISFTTNIKKQKEITARTLLADLLETTSLHLPTQRDVALKLSELYGASFGTSVSRYGNVYGVNFIINVVNDEYLAETTHILEDTFAFLNEVIFSPQIKDGEFVADIFQIQKQNLQAFLASLDDNKQGKALTRMNALYFRDQLQQIPAVGQLEDLSGITAKQMAQYYHKMITEDQVNIVVSGDVTRQQVKSAIKVMPFVARSHKQLDLVYSQPDSTLVKYSDEHENVSQSKLNLAYNLPVDHNSQDRFTAMVFNELFGGCALSLLFQNVREKNSLAYYAESDYDIFRQELWVQTGIQSENKEQVIDVVGQQLSQLRQGKIKQEQLDKIKASMINSYIARSDSQSVDLSKALTASLTGVLTPPKQWIANITAVQVEDIARIANRAHLQAVYFLDGRQE